MQDCQFLSHRRCVLSGSLCPAVGQVAHYPICTKVARWHRDKHYTLRTPVRLNIAVDHEDVRTVAGQRKWLQCTTTAQQRLDKWDLSMFCSSKLHACFCCHGWVMWGSRICVCVCVWPHHAGWQRGLIARRWQGVIKWRWHNLISRGRTWGGQRWDLASFKWSARAEYRNVNEGDRNYRQLSVFCINASLSCDPGP